MGKIPKHLHRVTLNELFAKSIPKEVGIVSENHILFRGLVKNIKNSSVEIEQGSTTTFIEIDIIDELFLYDDEVVSRKV